MNTYKLENGFKQVIATFNEKDLEWYKSVVKESKKRYNKPFTITKD
jgi:hypothetical protein